jgi:RNA polymerase sigma-70 factor (ECF subfamily)
VTAPLAPDLEGSSDLEGKNPEAMDMVPNHSGEDELVLRSMERDGRAFEELYRRYEYRIGKLVSGIVGGPQDGADVSQDVFCQVFRALPKFQHRSSFYTWIWRLATNVALQFRRSRSRRERLVVLSNEPAVRGESHPSIADPAVEVERRQTLARLIAAVGRLPESQRRAIVLRTIQGQPYARMARALGTNVQAIKGRLHRARVALRTLMQEDEEGRLDPPLLRAA